jgi:hypothetical protein
MTGRVQLVDQANRVLVDHIVKSKVSGPGEAGDISSKLSKNIVKLLEKGAQRTGSGTQLAQSFSVSL